MPRYSQTQICDDYDLNQLAHEHRDTPSLFDSPEPPEDDWADVEDAEEYE